MSIDARIRQRRRTPGPATGLTSAEVAERVARGQTNATSQASSRSLWVIFKTNVFTRFNAILGALFVLILSTGSLADGLFGVVLVVNSAIGIVQEYLAKRKLDRLALLNSPTTRVLRDGTLIEVPTADVVLDDLIELRTGDQVPADGTMLSTSGLEIDESNLTGEADAIPKSDGDEVRSGTTVVAGIGRFRAAAVGPDAYINKIAAEAKKFTKTRSEIQESVNQLLKYITWIIIIALPLQLWSQWRAIGDQGWQQVVIRSTGGLVGLVPEGLVLLTSVAFLLAAVQLTRQQVLVQELPAVEGLARVNIVCLDKTGTLTVGDIAYEDCEPCADLTPDEIRAALGALADDPNANGTLKALAAALDAPDGWQREVTIAFNSARKWSAASFTGRGSLVFGAPDVLLDRRRSAARPGQRTGAATGRRVLLLARSDAPLEGQTLPSGVTSVGLITLTEQVRPDAKETLQYFKDQGVRVKIISGDNPTTVGAIATRVGLELGPDSVVDARTIGDDPEELREIAEKTTVFGRVSPEQKRALVQALQRNGHVVAMTGDGVNDALALKDADIGVAMGNGAQATKAVAQLVLLDGRFSHMPSVLAEGRRVIGNVERVANLFVVEERDEPGGHHHRRAVHPAVPVPPPAPDAGLGGDDRHSGVLPGARAQQAPLHPRVPAEGAAVRGAVRRGRRCGGAGLVPVGPQRGRCPAGVRVPGEDRVQQFGGQRDLLAAVVRGDRRIAGHRVLDPGGAVPARSGCGRRCWSDPWSRSPRWRSSPRWARASSTSR